MFSRYKPIKKCDHQDWASLAPDHSLDKLGKGQQGGAKTNYHDLKHCGFRREDMFVYLRNLLTHTVSDLLQTLNNVKSIQFFAVMQKFNIIHIMCENFKTIPWVL